MYSNFKKNRRNVQAFFFETNFWERLKEDTFLLEEKNKNAELQKIEIQGIPIHQELEMAFLINLELDAPIVANAPKTKTVEKALLLISEATCYVFMFEIKSSLQADDDDISAIYKKFSDSIARISILLTTFVFGDNFKDSELLYKGIVFYNRDNNLISEANPTLKRQPIYRIFENKQGELGITALNKMQQVEVYFCKNEDADHKNTLTIDFKAFIDDYEYNIFKTYSTVSLPEVKG